MLHRARLALTWAAILLLTPVLLTACGGGDDDDAAPARPADGRYENSKMRFEFEYPKEWGDITDKVKLVVPAETKILDHVAIGTYEEQSGFMNGAQVSVVEIMEDISQPELEAELEALDETFRQQAATVRGKLLEPQWVELGGLKARQYVVEFVLGFDQAASAQTITFFGARQYTVNCQGRFSSFNELVLPGCEQLLQSFRFD